jgi:hypothetical protein
MTQSVQFGASCRNDKSFLDPSNEKNPNGRCQARARNGIKEQTADRNERLLLPLLTELSELVCDP